MGLADFIKEICFVIVLYKRKPEESPAFAALKNIASLHEISLFVYDNSPQPAEITSPFVIYHHDPSNSGVSKAYNDACRLAVRLQKKWLLLFDQDTCFDDEFLQHLFSSTQQHSNSIAFVPVLRDRMGIVSPFRWSFGRGKRIKKCNEKMALKTNRFANSGLLVSTESFKLVGGYPESIPLDFSDVAFAEKLRQHTDHFIVLKCTLKHYFSGSETLTLANTSERFHYFCLGAVEMVRLFGHLEILIQASLRAVYLSTLHANLTFLKVLITTIKNRPFRN